MRDGSGGVPHFRSRGIWVDVRPRMCDEDGVGAVYLDLARIFLLLRFSLRIRFLRHFALILGSAGREQVS